MSTKIDYDYRRGSDAVKDARAASVLQNMKDNAFFPDQPKPVLDLEKVHQQFSAARIDAENRDRQKAAAKNNVAKDLVVCLDQVAKYVTEKANGEAEILLSSGFKISADTASDFGPIENFKVVNGQNSGEAIVSCKGVKGADSYAFHYAIAGEAIQQWKQVFITAARATITDLVPGKNYVFYVEAIASKGRSVRSEQVTKYAA